MKPSEILKAAKALIELPENWTQGAFARDAQGEKCDIEVGSCFCTAGAIYKAGGMGDSFDQKSADIAIKTVHAALFDVVGRDDFSIPYYNDSRTHDDVMNLFDVAIEIAEKGEQQ